MQANANRSADVFEPAGFAIDVVGRMGRLYVFVIKTTTQHNVTISSDFPGIGVVVHGISVKNIVPIVNFGMASQLINRPIFLLAFGCADSNVFS